jgi:hypothetical protein
MPLISGTFMVSDRIFRKPLTAWSPTVVLVCTLALAPAAAWADGAPLILDTQKGISDGQKGVVLQSAPLSHEPIVTAKQPAGTATDQSSQPYVVAPYIEMSGGGAPRPNPPRPRPVPPRVPGTVPEIAPVPLQPQ